MQLETAGAGIARKGVQGLESARMLWEVGRTECPRRNGGMRVGMFLNVLP